MIPTLSGFLLFLRQQVGITTDNLPDDSIQITWAYNYAIEQVNTDIATVSALSYLIAVYNLATHILINIAIDQTGSTYFAQAQDKFGLARFTAGPISSSADVSTAESFATPDFVKNLSVNDLNMLKTPWGQEYMSIAMKYGSLWGIS
jgi:hypothetical protein